MNTPIENTPALKTSDRVRFKGEKRFGWTVQVAGERYLILTCPAPFQPAGTVDYTICDIELGKRGPSNFIGNGWDMESKGPYIGSRALHAELLAGRVEISNRSRATFSINDLELKG